MASGHSSPPQRPPHPDSSNLHRAERATGAFAYTLNPTPSPYTLHRAERQKCFCRGAGTPGRWICGASVASSRSCSAEEPSSRAAISRFWGQVFGFRGEGFRVSGLGVCGVEGWGLRCDL